MYRSDCLPLKQQLSADGIKQKQKTKLSMKQTAQKKCTDVHVHPDSIIWHTCCLSRPVCQLNLLKEIFGFVRYLNFHLIVNNSSFQIRTTLKMMTQDDLF